MNRLLEESEEVDNLISTAADLVHTHIFMVTCKKKEKYGVILLGTALILAAIALVTLASVPPVSRDALTHHLAIPKLYLKNGGIYEIPAIIFSYYPMNLDLLYMVPLYFQNDIAAKYIHFLFALLTALFIYKFIRENIGKLYGLLGALFFLTIPIIVKLSITVYVDLGLIFFSWMCIYFIFKWFSHQYKMRYLIISALFCGLALGTKYSALILLPIMGLMIPFFYSINQNNASSKNDKASKNLNSLLGLCHGGIFLLIALILFSPWMIRNYHWKKNPIYPLYNYWFVSDSQVKTGLEKSKSIESGSVKPVSATNPFKIRREAYHESFWESIFIPVRIFFQGRDDTPKYFDGKLSPFLLILPLFLLWKSKCRDNILMQMYRKFLFVFSFFFILFVLFTADMRIRYIAPVIAPLVVLSMFGLARLVEAISDLPRKVSGIAIMVVILTIFIGNISYIWAQFNFVAPISYLAAAINRDDYISRYRAEYAVVQYANRNLATDAKVLCLLVGHRTYYLERDAWIYPGLFFNPSNNEKFSEKTLLGRLSKHPTSHIIFGKDTYDKWAPFALRPYEMEVVKRFFKNNTRLLYQQYGHQLLEVKHSEPESGGKIHDVLSRQEE